MRCTDETEILRRRRIVFCGFLICFWMWWLLGMNEYEIKVCVNLEMVSFCEGSHAGCNNV